MTVTADIAIVGGGIAGLSLAWHLAGRRDVVVLEREALPATQATGRSAAIFSEHHGSPLLRRLTRASRAFYENPPEGFRETPLLTPRGVVLLQDRRPPTAEDGLELVEGAKLRALCPVLRPGTAPTALYEPGAMDLHVHEIAEGFRRGARARGVRILTDAGVAAMRRDGSAWRLETRQGAVAAAVVVNAAGAWADMVAALAGLPPLGIEPRRRTMIAAEVEGAELPPAMPFVVGAGESWYMKPEHGRLLASPADATPSPPCDAQPEEWDIALAAHRVEEATALRVRRIARAWAGLRSFAPDGEPVIGFDPRAAGFFWYAGQGGHGIEAAPAMAALAQALLDGVEAPEWREDLSALSPARLA